MTWQKLKHSSKRCPGLAPGGMVSRLGTFNGSSCPACRMEKFRSVSLMQDELHSVPVLWYTTLGGYLTLC